MTTLAFGEKACPSGERYPMTGSYSSIGLTASGHAAWQTFSLSRRQSPNFRDLLRTVADPKDDRVVTIVAGAGVSIDAGFPSWEKLLWRITGKLQAEDFRMLALSDNSDGLLRKAEYVTQMVLAERGNGTPEGVVADALYGATRETAPGPCANALAKLVIASKRRIRIATTNFDDVLEAALSNTVLRKRKVSSYVLTDASTWRRDKGLSVLHLHGLLPRGGNPRGDVILTESSFLKHGPDVRDLLSSCIEEGPVIFIGLSLTDPNLVGPLWTSREQRRYPRFALHVPPVLPDAQELVKGSADEAFDVIEMSRRYGEAKYGFVEKKLNLKPLYLKSYGQMTQALIELRLAVDQPSEYLRGRSPKTSIAYGPRFRRVLDAAYEGVGCGPDVSAPPAEEAFQLNGALRSELSPTAQLGGLLERLAQDMKKELNRTVGRMASPYPAFEEHFALYLWLRSRESDAFDVRYAINLVGSSAIAHADNWALRQKVPISPLSEFVMARSLFNGINVRENLPVKADPALWRGIVCVPVRAWEHGAGPESLVTLGGITLNTSHYIRPELVVEENARRPGKGTKLIPVSIVSVLDRASRQGLYSALEGSARRVLGLPTGI